VPILDGIFATVEKGSGILQRHVKVLRCCHTPSYGIHSTDLAHWSHCWIDGEPRVGSKTCS